jgi:hypothetical protein
MRRLWLLALLLLFGYGMLAWWFPLLGRATQLPLMDVRTFAPTLQEGLLYALLVCALFGGYWLAYRWVRQSAQPPPIWSILLVTLLFGLPLLLTYPVNAVDVFRYFFEGRMLVEHGANPLTTPPNALADDPLLPFAAILLDKSSPYGPLWELIGAGVYWLSRGSVLWGLLLFKGIGLALHLAAGIVIGRLLADEEPATRRAQMLLWLWNPALLFMFVIDAHNDILMLLCLLLGYQQIRQGQPLLGLLILVLAPLVKPIGLLPIPLFAVAAWQQMANWQQRIRLVLLATLGAALLTGTAFLPFGSPIPLLQRLADEARSGASFSPIEFVHLAGGLLGVELPLASLARGASVLMALAALGLFWWSWRGRTPLRGAADIFAAYLLTALKFRIWYPIWLFPWLVLDLQSRFRLYAGVWFLLLSQLSVVLYSHIRIAWLNDSIAIAKLIGVPLVFGLPLLFGYLANRLNPSQSETKSDSPLTTRSQRVQPLPANLDQS